MMDYVDSVRRVMSLFLHAGSPEAEAAKKKRGECEWHNRQRVRDIADDNDNKEVDENEHASRCRESPCVFSSTRLLVLFDDTEHQFDLFHRPIPSNNVRRKA
jgi:hypothetical protein